MYYFELFTALLCNISLSVLDKLASRKLTDNNLVLFFSFFKTMFCCVFALLFLPFFKIAINASGVLVSIAAGAFHAASVVLIMHCLKKCPAVYVNLFMSAGVILPSLFGFIFLSQPVTFIKIFFLLLLVFSLALTLDVKHGNSNWKLLITMFVCYGMLMVMQGLFPRICEHGSKMLFSAIMYGSSAAILGLISAFKLKQIPRLTKSLNGLCTILAAINLVINILLTSLSASLDAVVVFPTVHGIKLVAITLLSPYIWKERLNKVQILGSFLCIVCACVLSI